MSKIEAKAILDKYFKPRAYDVKEAQEMGRGILYFEEDALKAMEEYLYCKCKEAGKKLPDDKDIDDSAYQWNYPYGDSDRTPIRAAGAKWMKGLAEPVILNLLSHLEAKDKELQAIRAVEKGIVEKLLSTEKELQDAKADARVLKEEFDLCIENREGWKARAISAEEERDELRQGHQGLLQYQQKLTAQLQEAEAEIKKCKSLLSPEQLLHEFKEEK